MATDTWTGDFLLRQEGDSCILCQYRGTETAVRVPEGVTEIHRLAFHGVRLTAIHLPATLRRIDGGTFHQQFRLTGARIPEGGGGHRPAGLSGLCPAGGGDTARYPENHWPASL